MLGSAILAQEGGEEFMRKAYSPPTMVEFGSVGRLTLGSSGGDVDNVFDHSLANFKYADINASCSTGICFTILS